MISVIIALIAFACVAGGTLIGLFLGAVLSVQRLSSEAKDTVKLGTGLIGTMTAILLGLLIASAKSFFDAQNTGITEISAKVILLDRILAHYGSETKEIRGRLQSAVRDALDTMWPEGRAENSGKAGAPGGGEALYEKIQELSPQSDAQRLLQSQALNVAIDLAKTRWLTVEQASNSVSVPLLVVLVFWLSLIFCSFGLLAPRTPIVVATLGLCALSVSAAVFLVLDLYIPYRGVVRVSSAPLRTALDRLGK
jgi:hypothetical protein